MSNGSVAEPLGAGAGITGAGAGAVGAQRGASLIGQIAWAIGDGARSPYNVLVNIFIFAAYFTTVVIPDPVRGQTVWSYISAAGAILVAIGAPILGAIADAGGRRKPWLLACIVIGVWLLAEQSTERMIDSFGMYERPSPVNESEVLFFAVGLGVALAKPKPTT